MLAESFLIYVIEMVLMHGIISVNHSLDYCLQRDS